MLGLISVLPQEVRMDTLDNDRVNSSPTMFTPGNSVVNKEDNLRGVNDGLKTKCAAYPVVANYDRNTWGKYGLVKSMLNSSTGILSFQFSSMEGLDTMFENGLWSSYAQALIEVRADVELKDNDVLNSVEYDVDLGTTGGTSNLVSKKVNSSGSLFWNMESSSTSTTHIIEKIDKVERLIIKGKVTLVDDEGKPVTKVDSFDDHDNEDEVVSTDIDMANFLASKKEGYGTNSLLEQWNESYVNSDYDFNSYDQWRIQESEVGVCTCIPYVHARSAPAYDDDMYEGQDIIQDICDNFEINVRGRLSPNLLFEYNCRYGLFDNLTIKDPTCVLHIMLKGFCINCDASDYAVLHYSKSSSRATLAEHLPKAVAEQALVTDHGLAAKVLNEAYNKALAEEVSKLLDMEESKVVPIVQKMSEFPSTPKVLDKVKYVDPKQTNLADYMPNLPDLPQDPYKFIVDILSAKGDLSFEEIGKYLDFLIHTDPRWATDVLIRKVPQDTMLQGPFSVPWARNQDPTIEKASAAADGAGRSSKYEKADQDGGHEKKDGGHGKKDGGQENVDELYNLKNE
ncbi:hypothetical protein Tco_0645235 [Tanacetum coccineum]